MRTTALLLVLCATLAYAAEGAAPAPGADIKAQGKELEMKLKAMREQVIKDDAELGKLKAEADDARKRFETATEAKMKDNADYQALKAQLAELKGKKDGEKKKDGK
jgi:hypothetical protein